ncbi:MAG TPA: NifU family protein [Terracidiphilus sp.]|jgi:Fe-S cluster biogenesis protein NfuA
MMATAQTAVTPQERREFTRRSDRIEELVSRVENCGDPAMRAVAQELMQAVIELHGVALERIVDAVTDLPHGTGALEQMAQDDLVSNVLSLHGLNPIPLETRIASALETARPYLKAHGGDVELASIEDGTVHVALHGTCGSCSSSSETMKSTVESAIYDVAPEVDTVISATIPAPNPGLVSIQINTMLAR